MPQINLPRLLVVDDDPVHRMVISHIGGKAGYAVTGAASCADAEALARKHPFACITLDLSLGRDKGMDVLRALSGINCRAPIVIISDAELIDRQDNVRYATRAGLTIKCELPKPLDIARLREALDEVAAGTPMFAREVYA